MSSAALVYGCAGVALALFSNGVRKLPLMRRPWEHVMYFGIGAWVGTKAHEFKENNRQIVAEAMAKRAADTAAREARLAAKKQSQQQAS